MTSKNFTVYKSSAGSGKTFTLVKEYLALALNDEGNPPQAYKRILAVTFTNKAAAEMKDRIIKALKELSEDDYDKISDGTKTLLEALKKHAKLNVLKALDDATIRTRAKNILTTILHNYSDFAISTIDSFVHKVVRTFAYDLKIPMSFEIEMDDNKLLSQAIDLLIAQIGNNETLTKALIEFTESKTDNEKNWHIENDLLLFAKNLLNEEGAVYIDKLKKLTVSDFFKIKETLFGSIKKFETSIIEEARKANELISENHLSSTDFYYGDKGIAAYFQKLAAGKVDYIDANTYVVKTITEDKWEGGKVSKETKPVIENIKGKLLNYFNNIQIIKENDYSNYILFQLINKNIYSLAVLNEIEKLLIEYKTENNILHISEFNKMISKIVMNEPIPFIYERLGERYNNYLIDEFQDTSVLQFQNLLPLIDNALASGHFTMLVGDGKQAIYRWRGGEVEQFSSLPNVFAHNNNPLVLERENALKRNYNYQLLDKNYRSKREIVEFNNAIFKTLSNKLNVKYQSIYADLEQGFNPLNIGGHIQVEFIDAKAEAYRELNRTRTYETILQLQKDNYKLSDIVILVRKNSDGSDIANYLTEQNISVISSDSLLLSNSQEINFLYSLLKYLENTNYTIIHAELLEFLIAKNYITNTNINEALIAKNEIGLTAFLRKANIDFNIAVLSKMALYELCEELIQLFKLSETPNAYIQFFLDEVLNYTIKKNNNLTDFITYWEDKKSSASVVTPNGMNAVSIMTIHRSKGLEFPVVILPFCNSKVDMGKKNVWIDIDNEQLPNLPAALVPTNKDLEKTQYAHLYEDEKGKSLLDNLNVLYVALTRAEDRLYVFTSKPTKTPTEIKSVSDMFAYYFQSTGAWNESTLIYTVAEPVAHSSTKVKKQIQNYELSSFNSNRWREHIKMRAAAPTIWNTQATEAKKDYGVMVHTALARIKYKTDIAAALTSMTTEGLITLVEKENLTSTLTKIIQHAQLQPYFENGLIIKNESEIIAADGELFRPDRVILIDKKAVIIDYKTGSEKPTHKKQILQYANLMESMGYHVVEKLLVYIEEEKVVLC